MKSMIVIALALASVVSYASDKKEVNVTKANEVKSIEVKANAAAPFVASNEAAPIVKKTKIHSKKIVKEAKSAAVSAPVTSTTTKK